MAKVVFLYSKVNQAVKLGIDPEMLVPLYDSSNGVWDSEKKCWVKPNDPSRLNAIYNLDTVLNRLLVDSQV